MGIGGLVIPDFTNTLASTYKTNIDGAIAAYLRIAGMFAPRVDVTIGLTTTDIDTGTETITKDDHGFLDDDVVRWSANSGDSLPGGFSEGTDYHVVNRTEDTFQLSTSQGGSAVNITSTGSGTWDLIRQADMRITILKGSLLDGTTLEDFAAQEVGPLTAPTTNPRIDRVTLDISDDSTRGTINVVQGSEAASPSAPAIPDSHAPICQISLTTGQTEISASDVTDERNPGGYGVVSSGGIELIDTIEPSGVTTAVMDSAFNNTKYTGYMFVLSLEPVGTTLQIELSIDGGSSYITGGANYAWVVSARDDGGTDASQQNSSDDSIILIGNASNASTDGGLFGTVHMIGPAASGRDCQVMSQLSYTEGSDVIVTASASGILFNTTAVDAIRWRADTNSLTGTIKQYGFLA